MADSGKAKSGDAQAQDVVAALAEIPLFSGVPAPALEQIKTRGSRRKLKKGETLFSAGDPSETMYVVLSGRVRVWNVSAGGAEVTLNILQAGAVFGEIGLFDGGPRTASVSAVGTSEIFGIHRRDFFAVLDTEPQLGRNAVDLVCERLRWVSARLEDSALRSAPERLARILEHLIEDYGRETKDGTLIEIQLTQTELARWTMMSRESLNKILSRWSEDGLLKLNRTDILLLDLERLQEIAELGEDG